MNKLLFRGNQKLVSLFLLCFLFLFSACKSERDASQDQIIDKKVLSTKEIWQGRVVYEIFIQAFADTDGDSIGDFKGLTRKLDYLKELGVGAIWLMPIHPSPSYHKYDVTDYRGVHPDYGSMDDFKEMLDEAHQRDIKVIIDLVLNHCSEEHPWFVAAREDPQSPYRDYFVWAGKDRVAAISAREDSLAWTYHPSQWHENVYNPEDNAYYYGFFWKGMPDLNYDYAPLKKEIIDIGRFWLEEIGIDGFRLDAARHIFFDSESPKSHAWWQEFRREMEKIKPDVYLVGEVWDRADRVAPYLKGLHSSFNFDLGKSIIKLLQDEKDSLGLAFQLKQIRQMYDSINPTFLDATFITNHDQNRIMSELDNSDAKARIAASILLTLPGTPYIYYGEEIGMRGKKPDEQIREPFLWKEESEDQLRARWMEPQYSLDGEIVPLADQQKDKNAIWQHYRDLIQMRKDHPIISQGTLLPLDTQNEKLLAYQMVGTSQSYFIIHNISPEKASYPLPNLESKPVIVYSSEKDWILEKGNMELAPLSTLVLSGKFREKGPGKASQ